MLTYAEKLGDFTEVTGTNASSSLVYYVLPTHRIPDILKQAEIRSLELQSGTRTLYHCAITTLSIPKRLPSLDWVTTPPGIRTLELQVGR